MGIFASRFRDVLLPTPSLIIQSRFSVSSVRAT
jgi:hypothetical protein